MPLARFEKLDPERQRALLDAATAEFAENAFERASYNRIIETAGVSKGAVYYYFEDKADLYATVVRRVVDELATRVGDLGPVANPDTFWDEVAALARRTLEFLIGEPHIAALARDIYGGAARSNGRDPLGELVERANTWVERTLAVGQGIGAVRTDLPLDLLARALTGLLVASDRWFVERFEHLDPGELEALSWKVLELCRSLAAPTESNGGQKA